MINRILYRLNEKRLKDDRYTHIFDKDRYKNELIALDLETTGLNPKKDEILSIGAVKIANDKILLKDSLEIYTKPTNNISFESIKIHHIRPCDIENAEDINKALYKLLDFIGGRKIVGYYIKFDYDILNRYIKGLIGCKLPNELVEISSMYYKRVRKSSAYDFIDLKFDTILKKLDLPKLGKHNALNDAVMSAMIYLKLKHTPEYKGAYS